MEKGKLFCGRKKKRATLQKNENFTKDSTKVGNEKFYFNIKNAGEEHA